VEDELKNTIRRLPPLKAPFGEYRTAANHAVLLYQRIGAVTTPQPLLVFFSGGAGRSAVWCGEGLWKWRLHEFRMNGRQDQSAALLMKTVQYLVARDVKSPFRVIHKNSFSENENLVFSAELFNDAGEMINEPEVRMTLRNEQNKEFPYVFSRTDKGYQLDAGSFPAGRYRLKAETRIGRKPYRYDGELAVDPLQVELTETTANHQLLYALSEKSGGRMVYPGEASSLPDLIRNREETKPVIYTEKTLKELVHLKWFFFALLGLLALEWFLRKRSGGY
jgi:hypothetical protein